MRPARITTFSPFSFVPRAFRRVARLGLMLPLMLTGCGLFGGGAQLKQLQAENDKLVSEYRALRDRAAKQEEKIATLEARNSEAEKLLARSGISSQSNRAPQIASRPATSTSGNIPPYSPPNVPSLPDANGDSAPRWRPTKRQ